MRFLTHVLVTALALFLADYLVAGLSITSLPALLVAAVVLGLVNATVRPLLVLVTLPLTILTLGLFYLVVNGIAFGLAAALVPGFNIDSLGSAILAALVVAVASWVVGGLVKR